MNPLDAIPLIGAGLDAITGAASAKAQRDAFKHRYQDTVADMRKAGLNPALAYGQGGGNPSTVPLPELGSSLVKGVTGAAQAAQARAQAAKTAAETNLLNAQTTDLKTNLQLKNQLLGAQINQTGFRSEQIEAQTQNIKAAYQQLWLTYNFQKATFDDRIKLIRQTLESRGLDIDIKTIEKTLKKLSQPGAEAESHFYESLGAGGTSGAIQLLKLLIGALR